MSNDVIDYGKLVDDAMHIIVYKVLRLVKEQGLPGEHHFFISFITKFPGVGLSKALMDKYPREMTIVLQYQYEDLEVTQNHFSVSLSFNGVKENIKIPYAAITTFADPSVQFGLQFREVAVGEEEDLSLDVLEDLAADIEVEKEILEREKDKGKKTKSTSKKKKSSKKKDDDNVVSLDTFRKK